MKNILIFILFFFPILSYAQVYQNSYEASKAAYQNDAIKHCGEISCIPKIEPEYIEIEIKKENTPTTTPESFDDFDPEPEILATSTTDSKLADLQSQINQLMKLVALLTALVELQNGAES